jgi:uncharacterized protein involved in exopolysaccharide biosynthesis
MSVETVEQAPPHEADEEPVLNIDFRRYVSALRKHVWLIGALIIAAIACAVVYTSRVTPVYEAKASGARCGRRTRAPPLAPWPDRNY